MVDQTVEAGDPPRVHPVEPIIEAMRLTAIQHAEPGAHRAAPFDHEAALAAIIAKNREVDAARAVQKRRAEDAKSAKQIVDDLAAQLGEMIAEFGARLDDARQPGLFQAVNDDDGVEMLKAAQEQADDSAPVRE